MKYAAVQGKQRHISGWIPDLPDHRDRMMVAPPTALPSRVDKLPFLSPVQDQESIGSCTANATVSAVEYLERAGAAAVDFSRLYLYYWSRVDEGVDPSDDSGCQLRDVIKTYYRRGCCYEKTWPYQNPNSFFSKRPLLQAELEASSHRLLFYYRCNDVFTVKASIHQGFPVVFGFSVPNNFMTPQAAKDGICYYPSPTENFSGAHAVLAVGYDDEMVIGEEEGAVLCQNSWGTAWGLDGFFWLPYKFWQTGLARDNWTIRRAML